MRVSVTVEGLQDIERVIGGLTSRFARRRVGRRALAAAADPIRDKAVQLAPDDPQTSAPRDLKSSITVALRQRSGRARSTGAGVGEVKLFVGPTSAGYPQAVMQEFGTVHHAAQPYMRPAWDSEGGALAVERVRGTLAEEAQAEVGRQQVKVARAARRAARQAR